MGYTIGDGIIVIALAAAFYGYFYLKHLERQRRLEIIHQERLTAMDKGIPLPELPIDPPRVQKPPDPHVPLILGIVLLAVGAGTMVAFGLVSAADTRMYWPMPLPLALVGLGLVLYYFLAANRER